MSESTSAVAHVLVVDDDTSILDFLELLLEEEGFRVSRAGDGIEALRQIEAAPPDVILLDLAMPRMDGRELVARLRQQGPAPPVIFMSAGYDAQREAERHGVNGYLGKPFSAEDLLDRIRRVLSDSG